MPADRVVEHLDVVEHVRCGGGPGRVDPPLDPLLLQDAEEALGHGVVVAVPATAHARHHPVRLQERLPVAVGELAALIGVDHQHPLPAGATDRALRANGTRLARAGLVAYSGSGFIEVSLAWFVAASKA